jgi:hypothetical protein
MGVTEWRSGMFFKQEPSALENCCCELRKAYRGRII